MEPGRALRQARRRAGLTQRALAARTGVAQPTIARIEGALDDPRMSTLSRLLRACGETLEATPTPGLGVDRTEIRELLTMTPSERLAALVEESIALGRLAHAVPIGRHAL